MQAMKRRKVAARVREALRDWPAVVLVGPRQCGKTTLARALSQSYFDLEQNEDRVRLDAGWAEVTTSRRLMVFDEAQSWPEVFPRLRGAIDRERKRAGRFLLTGSVSPGLMRDVSESLAGRLAVIEMSPFLAAELGAAERKRHWLCGGFPDGGVLVPRRFPEWQTNYLALLVGRDLPSWGLAGRPRETERLLRMIALSHGQIWNASRIGQSLGISYHTVNAHLEFLEGAFLVRRLPPFAANLGKRLVKSPKLYLRDSGLLHALLGVATEKDLWTQPWVGASWEGYVIESILAELAAAGRGHQAHYLRTSDGYEIDLVLDLDGERWAIEVKLTSSPSPDEVSRLEQTAKLVEATRAVLVCRKHVGGDAKRVLITDVGHLLAALARA
jgi:predicted AAA+ superfamily ATPase